MTAACRKMLFASSSILLLVCTTWGCTTDLPLEGSACDSEHPCPNGYRCTSEVQGQCYPMACDDTPCATDEVCVEDGCIETGCFGMECDSGERCANQRCWPEDCPQQECADGEVCEEDTCVLARCVEGLCDCTTEEVPGESCSDEIDNDCDGSTDCEDSDCTFSQEPCGWCGLGSSICQADQSWSECGGDTGCEPDSTQPCGELDCSSQTCQADCSWGECPLVEPVRVCDKCGTGVCRDYLIEETNPDCGCANSTSAPNCNNTSYDVPCGGADYCRYQRREVTEDCNCEMQCP